MNNWLTTYSPVLVCVVIEWPLSSCIYPSLTFRLPHTQPFLSTQLLNDPYANILRIYFMVLKYDAQNCCNLRIYCSIWNNNKFGWYWVWFKQLFLWLGSELLHRRKFWLLFPSNCILWDSFPPIICMRIYAEVERKRLGNKEKRQEIFLAAGIAA